MAHPKRRGLTVGHRTISQDLLETLETACDRPIDAVEPTTDEIVKCAAVVEDLLEERERQAVDAYRADENPARSHLIDAVREILSDHDCDELSERSWRMLRDAFEAVDP